MTITDSIDRPTKTIPEIRAHLDATGKLYREDMIDHMLSAGRDELVHYAGAAHRDQVARAMCKAWLADPAATESELKSRALAATGWGSVTPAQIRAANSGMR